MCGYIIHSKKPSVEVLREQLIRQRSRGVDGFGAIHLPTGKSVKALSMDAFLKLFAGAFPKDGSIVVHHRKASLGGISTDLVHPITNGDQTDLLVMQNGTKKELVSITGSASDTVSIARLWPLLKGTDMLEPALYGGGLVMVLDKGELIVSHDGERTLFFCESGIYKGTYSSEPLCAGMWRECPALQGLPSFPLKVTEWEVFLPLLKADEYVDDIDYDCNPPKETKVPIMVGKSYATSRDYKDTSYDTYYTGAYGYVTNKPVRKRLKTKPKTTAAFSHHKQLPPAYRSAAKQPHNALGSMSYVGMTALGGKLLYVTTRGGKATIDTAFADGLAEYRSTRSATGVYMMMDETLSDGLDNDTDETIDNLLDALVEKIKVHVEREDVLEHVEYESPVRISKPTTETIKMHTALSKIKASFKDGSKSEVRMVQDACVTMTPSSEVKSSTLTARITRALVRFIHALFKAVKERACTVLPVTPPLARVTTEF